MKIVIATNNKKKLTELRAILAPIVPGELELLTLADIGFTGDIAENGSTFAENAAIKASAIAALGYIAIADDSGLCVDALGGAPGIYSARYSGGSDRDNNEKLLRELENVPRERRTARFVCSVICLFPDGRRVTAEECCEGIILEQPDGEGGFGYDPLFFYEPDGVSFARLTPERKNQVSHRGKALRALAARLVPSLS